MSGGGRFMSGGGRRCSKVAGVSPLAPSLPTLGSGHATTCRKGSDPRRRHALRPCIDAPIRMIGAIGAVTAGPRRSSTDADSRKRERRPPPSRCLTLLLRLSFPSRFRLPSLGHGPSASTAGATCSSRGSRAWHFRRPSPLFHLQLLLASSLRSRLWRRPRAGTAASPCATSPLAAARVASARAAKAPLGLAATTVVVSR